MIAINVALAWLLADFLSGLVHWWEDRHLHEGTLLRSVYEDNSRHHDDPMSITRISWWGNIGATCMIATPISLSLFIAGAHSIIYLSVAFAGFGNLVHRFSHERRSRLPRVVKLLQWAGIFCSARQHNEHHRRNGLLVRKDDATWRFCAMTNYLNPILDGVGFWKFLDRLVKLR